MTSQYETEIRRNRISNLIEEEPLKYDLEHPKKIAEALDLDYEIVKKDLKVIKEKYHLLIKEYNLLQLIVSLHKKHERMEDLQKKAHKAVEESTGKSMLDAMQVEMNIMNNMYHLEVDGLNPLVEELEEMEQEEREALKSTHGLEE